MRASVRTATSISTARIMHTGMAAVMRDMKVTAVDTDIMSTESTVVITDTAHTEITRWKAPLWRCFLLE